MEIEKRMFVRIVCTDGACEIDLRAFADLCEFGSTMLSSTLKITDVKIDYSLEAVVSVLFIDDPIEWSCGLLDEIVYVIDFLQVKKPARIFHKAYDALRYRKHKKLGNVVRYMLNRVSEVSYWVNIMDSESLMEFVQEDIHNRWALLDPSHKLYVHNNMVIPLELLADIIHEMDTEQTLVIFNRLFDGVDFTSLTDVNGKVVRALAKRLSSFHGPKIKRKVAVLRCFEKL